MGCHPGSNQLASAYKCNWSGRGRNPCDLYSVSAYPAPPTADEFSAQIGVQLIRRFYGDAQRGNLITSGQPDDQQRIHLQIHALFDTCNQLIPLSPGQIALKGRLLPPAGKVLEHPMGVPQPPWITHIVGHQIKLPGTHELLPLLISQLQHRLITDRAENKVLDQVRVQLGQLLGSQLDATQMRRQVNLQMQITSTPAAYLRHQMDRQGTDDGILRTESIQTTQMPDQHSRARCIGPEPIQSARMTRNVIVHGSLSRA